MSDVHIEHLRAWEKVWIWVENTYENGLNCTPGGEASPAKCETVRAKLSAAMKGNTNAKESWTKERREKHSKRVSGQNNPFFGKKHTDSTRELCREGAKKQHNERAANGKFIPAKGAKK